MKRVDAVLGGIVLASGAAVGVALISQHMFNMQPCPWCVLQRLIFVAIGGAAVIGVGWRSVLGHRLASLLALALCACGAAAALWQHFVAASSASCNLTLAERIISTLGLDEAMPSVFMALASCAEAAVKLAGVPYDLWSLTL